MTQQNQQQQFALDQQSQYTQNSHMYQSTANTGDLLGSGNLALTGASPLISSVSGVPSLNTQLGTGFDGGNQAKPLPFQNSDSPNAKIAEIARNSNQIDPFASLASSRAMGASMSTLHGPSASNPFAMTGTNQGVSASSTPDLLGDSGGGLGMTTQPQMSSLVDLSPASLGNNTNGTSSTALTTSISSSLGFGPAVNKNPFATGTSSTWSSQKTSKVSLNDLIKRQQQSHSRPVSPHHNPYASQQMASSTNSFHTQNSSSNVLQGMGHLNLGSPNFTPTNGAGTPSGFGQLHSTNTPMFQQQTQQSSNLYSNHTTFHSIGPSGTSGVNANPFGVNPSGGGGGAPTSFNNISHNTTNTFNPF
ncbi:hypothetical protein IWQ61_010675 [Dispira simplex]|nr:hypothetical protein IWQ61_010675 [Dispira simplex]